MRLMPTKEPGGIGSRPAPTFSGVIDQFQGGPLLLKGRNGVCHLNEGGRAAPLVGLSRQRVNQALTALDGAGVIRVEYGGVRVLDLERLRRYAADA